MFFFCFFLLSLESHWEVCPRTEREWNLLTPQTPLKIVIFQLSQEFFSPLFFHELMLGVIQMFLWRKLLWKQVESHWSNMDLYLCLDIFISLSKKPVKNNTLMTNLCSSCCSKSTLVKWNLWALTGLSAHLFSFNLTGWGFIIFFAPVWREITKKKRCFSELNVSSLDGYNSILRLNLRGLNQRTDSQWWY